MAEFRSSVDIRATPGEVFDYLVTPTGLTAWLGQQATVDPREDGLFAVDIAGSPIRGRYLEVDPPHSVTVSWGVSGSDDLPPGSSRVRFVLTPTDDGTRVDLVHSGLPEPRLDGHADGWAHFLLRLASAAQGELLAPDEWIPVPNRLN